LLPTLSTGNIHKIITERTPWTIYRKAAFRWHEPKTAKWNPNTVYINLFDHHQTDILYISLIHIIITCYTVLVWKRASKSILAEVSDVWSQSVCGCLMCTNTGCSVHCFRTM